LPKLTITQLPLAGRRVFIRADLNAPLAGGAVADDTRLTAVIPTIQHALGAGASVVLASHLGRPGGKPTPKYSLRPVAARLASAARLSRKSTARRVSSAPGSRLKISRNALATSPSKLDA